MERESRAILEEPLFKMILFYKFGLKRATGISHIEVSEFMDGLYQEGISFKNSKDLVAKYCNIKEVPGNISKRGLFLKDEYSHEMEMSFGLHQSFNLSPL